VKEVLVLLGAEIDLQQIYSLHEDRSDAAARRVTKLVREALVQLSLFPESGRIYHGRFRRLVVPKTPYVLFYRVDPLRVAVAAVLDMRQDPQSIIARLRSLT
jgi:plasmid stabilization system protein ParE